MIGRSVVAATTLLFVVLSGCTGEQPEEVALHGFHAVAEDGQGRGVEFTFSGPYMMLDDRGAPRAAWRLAERHLGDGRQGDADYYVDSQWRLVRHDLLCPYLQDCAQYRGHSFFYSGGPAPYGLGMMFKAGGAWSDHAGGPPKPIQVEATDAGWRVNSSHMWFAPGEYTFSPGRLLPSGPDFTVVEYDETGGLERAEEWPVRPEAPRQPASSYIPDWETQDFGTGFSPASLYDRLMEEEPEAAEMASNGCLEGFSVHPNAGGEAVAVPLSDGRVNISTRMRAKFFIVDDEGHAHQWLVQASRDAFGRESFTTAGPEPAQERLRCPEIASAPMHQVTAGQAVEAAVAVASHQGLDNFKAEFHRLRLSDRSSDHGWGRYNVHLVPAHVDFNGTTTTYRTYSVTINSATGAFESLLVAPGDFE